MDIKPLLIMFINDLLGHIDTMRYLTQTKKEAIVTVDRIEESSELIFKVYLTIHWNSLKQLRLIKQNQINFETRFDNFGNVYFYEFDLGGFGVNIDVNTKKKKIDMILDIKYKNMNTRKHYKFLAKILSEQTDDEINNLFITNPAMLELYQSQEFLNQIEKEKLKRLNK